MPASARVPFAPLLLVLSFLLLPVPALCDGRGTVGSCDFHCITAEKRSRTPESHTSGRIIALRAREKDAAYLPCPRGWASCMRSSDRCSYDRVSMQILQRICFDNRPFQISFCILPAAWRSFFAWQTHYSSVSAAFRAVQPDSCKIYEKCKVAGVAGSVMYCLLDTSASTPGFLLHAYQ